MKSVIQFCLAFLSLFAANVFAVSSSTHYQLNYADFDSGGGRAVSASYLLNASVIGKGFLGGNLNSINYQAIDASALIDIDGDGLEDGVEQLVFNTSPIDFDTDSDTLNDLEEVVSGTDPLDSFDPLGFIRGNDEDIPFLPLWALLLLVFGFVSIAAKRRSM